jgi:transposase
MARLVEYSVCLSGEERSYLDKNTISGTWPPRIVRRALILLKADANANNPMPEEEIAKEVRCSLSTVKNIKLRFAKGERLKVIKDHPRSGRPRIADGEIEAHIIATTCSAPPEGQVRWTLGLVADKVVTLTGIESCSRSTVCRTLKKMNLSLG